MSKCIRFFAWRVTFGKILYLLLIQASSFGHAEGNAETKIYLWNILRIIFVCQYHAKKKIRGLVNILRKICMLPNAQRQLMGSGFITYLLDLLTDMATSVHNFSRTLLFEQYVNLWSCIYLSI